MKNGDAGRAGALGQRRSDGSPESGESQSSGPPRSGSRSVEEGSRSSHVITHGVVKIVQVSGGARLAQFGVVSHLLLEMDADALHFDGDDLGVDQSALEEPAFV